jgi:hypothetical protein
MQFAMRPLIVECHSCGTSAETYDYAHPDLAVECNCCPIAHDHTGLGCRTVAITVSAHLTIFNIEDLLEMAGGEDASHGDVRSDDSRQLAECDPA